MDKVYRSSSNFGLKINITKTEVQDISKQPQPLNITINGETLKQTEKFTYLGGIISQSGTCSDEVQHRIGKALGVVKSLNKIWSAKDISCPTKIELYRVLVLSILLYGAETWTLKKIDENRLNTFEMTCLRKIMGVTRLDKIRNDAIRKSLNIEETINDRVATKRPRYFGHVNRMHQDRNPQIVIHGNIHGNRPRGRPPKKWIDCIKMDCSTRNISSLATATRLTRDREKWRAVVKQKPSHIPSMVWTA